MKQKFYYLLLFFFIVCMGSCNKDDLIQIFPGDNEKVIDVKMYDVGLKFYLQNEQGEPVTTFKEGENFSICWSMTNYRESQLYLDNDFPPEEIGNIYTSDGVLIGKADGFSGIYPEMMYYIIDPKETISCSYYWMDSEVYIQQPLSRGNYYIGFSYSFDLSKYKDKHYKDAITEKKDFRIYFTVE